VVIWPIIYGVEVSKDFISQVTDAVLDDVKKREELLLSHTDGNSRHHPIAGAVTRPGAVQTPAAAKVGSGRCVGLPARSEDGSCEGITPSHPASCTPRRRFRFSQPLPLFPVNQLMGWIEITRAALRTRRRETKYNLRIWCRRSQQTPGRCPTDRSGDIGDNVPERV